MERLCIASFLRHGHPFHLYLYQATEGVPPGTVVLDANKILPASRIFIYSGFPSYAGFANFFRYKLLLEKGGWFVDADTICLKPFEFTDPFVFSSEYLCGERIVNLAAVKTPAGSAVMEYAWDACQGMDLQTIRWGQCGPRLITQATEQHALRQYVQAPEVFCPLQPGKWEQLLNPAARLPDGATSCAIHLWNEMWRRAGKDKEQRYPRGCPYERLKRRYLSRRGPREWFSGLIPKSVFARL